MSVFTFVMTYRGGIYVTQHIARESQEAFDNWLDALRENRQGFTANECKALLDDSEDEHLVPLEGLKNAWAFSLLGGSDLAVVHVVESCPCISDEKPPHPLDLAYWTLESSPKFEESYFMEDVREYVKKYSTW